MPNQHFKHRFDTWSEFMATANNPKRNPASDTSSDNKHRGRWAGTETYDEALRYLNEGWHSGIKRIRDLQRTLPSDLFNCIMPVEDYKPELQHKIAGGIIDIPMAITESTPETFIQEVIPHDIMDDTKVKGRRLLTVYYNIANSSSMPEEAFFYRGAYTFLMIEHMEQCGYSVEVWVVNCITSPYDRHNNRSTTYIKVKEFGEFFDTNKLAIALASAFILRRFEFRIQEQACDEEVQTITNMSYGMPDQPQLKTIVLSEDIDRNPMWLGTVNETDKDKMLVKFKQHLEEHLSGHMVWDTE